jgi:multimeric flavodoxin WrbA
MTGIYFSGTGNTKHCVSYFTAQYGNDSKCVPLESDMAAKDIVNADMLVLGYPVYFSNAPKIVRDFITANKL